MNNYVTKQRKILLSFFSSHPHEAFSAKSIYSALNCENISISAVYRNLTSLEKEGVIKRTSKIGSREAFFQYINIPECKEALHLSCEKCGKTYHMNNSHMQEVLQSILKNESFAVDNTSSVLYGLCKDCQ